MYLDQFIIRVVNCFALTVGAQALLEFNIIRASFFRSFASFAAAPWNCAHLIVIATWTVNSIACVCSCHLGLGARGEKCRYSIAGLDFFFFIMIISSAATVSQQNAMGKVYRIYLLGIVAIVHM